jgi:CHAT domain-containing protein/tetratricopeptide (TPR) repeat protein
MFGFLLLIPLSIGLGFTGFPDPGPSRNQIHKKLTEADSLFGIEQYEKAYHLYQDVVTVAAAEGNDSLTAYGLKGLGNIWYLFSDLEKAKEHYGEALSLFKGLGDFRGEAKIYNNLGIIAEEETRYADARNYYQQAFGILQGKTEVTREDREDEVALLGNIGHLLEVQAEPDSAVYYYRAAIDRAEDIGYVRGEGDALHNIGNIYQRSAQYDSALFYYKRSKELFEQMQNAKGVADNLREMGATERKRGAYGNAIAFLEQAVGLFGEMRTEGIVRGELETQNALGLVYQEIGRYEKAIEYFDQVLSRYRSSSDSVGTAIALENLGMVYFEMVDENSAFGDSALAYLDRSIAIFKKAGKQRQVAHGLNNKGLLYQRLGVLFEAESHFRKALENYATAGDNPGQARAHSNIATLCMIQQEHEKAIEHYEQAISLLERETEPVLLATSLASLGIAYRNRGKTKKAAQTLRSAVRIVEDLRGGLVTQEFKSSFIEDKIRIYEELIDLLLGQGGVEEAFHYVERAKARALLDMLGGKAISTKRFGTRARELIGKEQALLRKMEFLDDGEEKSRVFVAYQEILASIEQEYPEYLTLKRVEPVNLRTLQRGLDDETIILEYFLCHRGVYLFAVDSKGVSAQKLHIAPEELYRDVEKFRQFILSFDLWEPFAIKLYEKLVKVVEDELEHKKRVCIVPHGILHHLPFNALLVNLEPKEFLIEKHDLFSVPSSSILDIAHGKNRKERKKSLVLAKSDFSDHPGWRDLEGTVIEKDLLVEGDLLPGATWYENADATEERLKDVADQYDFLHLATHGELNKEDPLRSRVLLTASTKDDGSLTVGEIFSLDLSAYLVTLSACETGEIGSYVAGREFSSGDDLVGLTRAFIFAGTPSVVASLWYVSDAATVLVMERFYQELKGNDKAHSLCEAQRYMIRESDYPAPIFWAPFVLFGDWE